jgi:hypothetical protein
MTQEEWQAATDPTSLLNFVAGRSSDRKLRLFAVACSRNALSLLQSQNFRKAVEVSERFADGLASDDQLRKARSRIRESAERIRMVRAYPWTQTIQKNFARRQILSVCSRNIEEMLQTIDQLCVVANSADSYRVKCEEERTLRAQVLRCIFGNPFRPCSINHSWLTSTAFALANSIYSEKAFDRMPILADALQDAGCDNEEILTHCRSQGPHSRGCWCVDLLLDKK